MLGNQIDTLFCIIQKDPGSTEKPLKVAAGGISQSSFGAAFSDSTTVIREEQKAKEMQHCWL